MGVFIFVAVLVIAFVVGKIKEASGSAGDKPSHNARLQQLIETFQSQQSGNVPPPVQGQFTQPTGGAGYSPPQYSQPAQLSPSMAPAQDSAQIAGMHNQLVQQVLSPRDRRRAAVSGPQPPSGPGQVVYNAGPAQWVPNQLYPVQSTPPQYQEPYYPQAPVPRQPTPRNDTDQRVRELMQAGNMIAAVRLLSDEQDMGILEAQQYAQSLTTPPPDATPPRTGPDTAGPAGIGPSGVGSSRVGSSRDGSSRVGSSGVGSANVRPGGAGPGAVGPGAVGPGGVGPAGVGSARVGAGGVAPTEAAVDDSAAPTGSAAISGGDGEPYLGSTAFAESLFEPSHDDGTWASGWTEPTPDPTDRADIDELWQTVRNPPRRPASHP